MLETVPATILDDLKRRHAESGRHYHDWTHVEALLGHCEAAGDRIHDSGAVLYAILFHDAVYDPRAKDNERRSAELLFAKHPPLAEDSLDLARRMIEATEGHVLPEDLSGKALDDCAYFLDMDLGILGANEARFDIYEDQIRLEYAHVPDDAFRAGRAAVLRHFADRERLYFTQWGRDRFEARARANIARSLAALGS
jgi:predicted metal-dependent HD superfamily phosphohydrolase